MDEFINLFQKFAFNLAVAILPIISAFLVAALNALVKKWLAELEATKPQLSWYLREAVDIAIHAAEQAGVQGYVDDKLQFAINIAQEYLNEHGWDEVNVAVLEAAIEAEVLKQFPK